MSERGRDHWQQAAAFELPTSDVAAPDGSTIGGTTTCARVYHLLAETARRGHSWPVGHVQAPPGWVPVWVLREPWAGGSAGDRRMRDLRERGFRIDSGTLPGSRSTILRLETGSELSAPSLRSSAAPPGDPAPAAGARTAGRPGSRPASQSLPTPPRSAGRAAGDRTVLPVATAPHAATSVSARLRDAAATGSSSHVAAVEAAGAPPAPAASAAPLFQSAASRQLCELEVTLARVPDGPRAALPGEVLVHDRHELAPIRQQCLTPDDHADQLRATWRRHGALPGLPRSGRVRLVCVVLPRAVACDPVPALARALRGLGATVSIDPVDGEGLPAVPPAPPSSTSEGAAATSLGGAS
ncbi:MAG: hypothetical protein AAGN46_05555 [Acidobacteriota bacterium]